MLAHLPTRWASLAFIRILAAGTIRSMTGARDAHGGIWDALQKCVQGAHGGCWDVLWGDETSR